jgi:hypothetical protein
MRLTPTDLREIRQIIDDHWTSLVAETYGPDAIGLAAADVQRLVDAGVLDPSVLGTSDPIGDARALGLVETRLKLSGIDPALATVEQVRAAARNAAPLMPIEQEAAAFARQYAAQHAVALGNRVADQILSAVNVEDATLRAQMLTTIRTKTAEAIETRASISKLTSSLRNATGDYARDWRRIAATEMQRAHQHGVATSIARDLGDGGKKDPLVAKIPTPAACPRCRDLYTEGGKPRIFRLSELMANGENVGRKAKEWLPTVGPIHPACMCGMVSVHEGWSFDDDWSLRPPEPVAPAEPVAP